MAKIVFKADKNITFNSKGLSIKGGEEAELKIEDVPHFVYNDERFEVYDDHGRLIGEEPSSLRVGGSRVSGSKKKKKAKKAKKTTKKPKKKNVKSVKPDEDE